MPTPAVSSAKKLRRLRNIHAAPASTAVPINSQRNPPHITPIRSPACLIAAPLGGLILVYSGYTALFVIATVGAVVNSSWPLAGPAVTA